jgi:hypothetical protein
MPNQMPERMPLKDLESVSLRVQVNALGCQNIWQKKYQRVSMSEYMADKL